MSNQVYFLENYDFTSSDALLFDANIWLYIYGLSNTRHTERLKRKYEQQFRRIRSLKVPIFLDVLVLSEFINAYSRQFYNRLPEATKPANFKTFRNSEAFQPIAQEIGKYSRRILAKTQRTNIAFESVEMGAIINSYVAANADFNDLMLAELCKANGFKLVTHDADFKGDDLTILTANSKLLSGS
jgi:predicted nucleic acid-binding protein